MKKTKRKRINKVSAKLVDNNLPKSDILGETPDTKITETPYAGYISNEEYYNRLKADCFSLDPVLENIVKTKFSGYNLRHMSTEDALSAYSVLEKAKNTRSKIFLEMSKALSDDAFYRKQQEIELLRRLPNKNEDIIEAEVVSEEPKLEMPRQEQLQVLRLLQQAVQNKLDGIQEDDTD